MFSKKFRNKTTVTFHKNSKIPKFSNYNRESSLGRIKKVQKLETKVQIF
jgi:hypothetical protein